MNEKENEIGDTGSDAVWTQMIGNPADMLGAGEVSLVNGFEINPAERRNRGAIIEEGRTVVGRVGAPPRQEATSSRFHFWVPEEVSVEATQIVTTESECAGESVTYFALVEEVHRCSRRRDMGQEIDEFDGDLSDEPPYKAEGITYADAVILRADPERLAPPRERSKVCLAGPEAAAKAYGIDEVSEENRLPVGLIKNGGTHFAGPGCLDLDYLLGGNGGHMNVSGAAGRATKSSFLLQVVYMLLRHARDLREKTPNVDTLPRPVPIIFNVKNFDLFYLDYTNRGFDVGAHGTAWQEIGVPEPKPFENVRYFAPRQKNGNEPIPTGRPGNRNVTPYSWSLKNIIERGLFLYLFSAEDTSNDNFLTVLYDIEEKLTHVSVDEDGVESRTLRTDAPQGRDRAIQTFADLREWLQPEALGGEHHRATILKVQRRIKLLLHESRGVLRVDGIDGNPLDVTQTDITDPCVVDLNGLSGVPHLQRFVVASVLRQVVESRTGAKAVPGLRYLIVLDELNRFAPRGAKDPITKLVETVAAEMRSQGVILLGAQQQASMVSERVVENAAVKVLGQTGSVELRSDVWRTLSEATRRRAEGLRPNEKLVMQSGFRQPMYLHVPFPIWAMRKEEADITTSPLQRNIGIGRNEPGRETEDISTFGDI